MRSPHYYLLLFALVSCFSMTMAIVIIIAMVIWEDKNTVVEEISNVR